MKKVSAKKRSEVSNIWFYSKMKSQDSNLVLKYTEQGENYYFTIGTYSFNSVTGISKITPLHGMEKMNLEKVLSIINN